MMLHTSYFLLDRLLIGYKKREIKKGQIGTVTKLIKISNKFSNCHYHIDKRPSRRFYLNHLQKYAALNYCYFYAA